jgi:hypothetical protein
MLNLSRSLLNVKFNKAIEEVKKTRVINRNVKSRSPFSNNRHKDFLPILTLLSRGIFRRLLFIRKAICNILCNICL